MGLNLLQYSPKRRGHDRGAALTECAIALPVLAILMVATFEIGRVFTQYLTLSQIAYEGARAGSQLILDDTNGGCFDNFVMDDLEATQSVSPHRKVMDRVIYLLGIQKSNVSLKCDSTRRNNLCNASTQNPLAQYSGRPTVSAEYIPASATYSAPSSCGNITNRRGTYAIRVRGIYNALLLPISFPVSVESRAMVLTSNQNFSSTLTGAGTGVSVNLAGPSANPANPI